VQIEKNKNTFVNIYICKFFNKNIFVTINNINNKLIINIILFSKTLKAFKLESQSFKFSNLENESTSLIIYHRDGYIEIPFSMTAAHFPRLFSLPLYVVRRQKPCIEYVIDHIANWQAVYTLVGVATLARFGNERMRQLVDVKHHHRPIVVLMRRWWRLWKCLRTIPFTYRCRSAANRGA